MLDCHAAFRVDLVDLRTTHLSSRSAHRHLTDAVTVSATRARSSPDWRSSPARALQAPGSRLGPAQSPRPIQHTHDTVTRRGRAHVPARPVGDASLSRTPLPSYSVPRPAAGGRSSTGSQNMETNLSIPGRRSIMHHFNYFHLETNAMMSPYTLHVTIFETSPQKCERASHHDRTQDRTLG